MSKEKQTYNPCDDCQYSYSKNGQESGMCKICELTYFKDRYRKQSENVIELPCKVGDMLYDIYDAISNGGDNIRELKVPEIHINLDRRNKPWIIISSYYFAFEDFGKTVFFSREEAEKALAERR